MNYNSASYILSLAKTSILFLVVIIVFIFSKPVDCQSSKLILSILEKIDTKIDIVDNRFTVVAQRLSRIEEWKENKIGLELADIKSTLDYQRIQIFSIKTELAHAKGFIAAIVIIGIVLSNIINFILQAGKKSG